MTKFSKNLAKLAKSYVNIKANAMAGTGNGLGGLFGNNWKRQQAKFRSSLPKSKQQARDRLQTRALENSISGSGAAPNIGLPPGALPVTSELYEARGTYTLPIGAANILRVQSLGQLDSYLSISDEETRQHDLWSLVIHIVGNADGYPQSALFFTVKGPNAMVFTNSDKAAASGIKAGIDGSLSGGSQIQYFPTVNLGAFQENGSLIKETNWYLDGTDILNRFTRESEEALAQGRSQPKLYLGVAIIGTASSTMTWYYQLLHAYHSRRRRLQT